MDSIGRSPSRAATSSRSRTSSLPRLRSETLLTSSKMKTMSGHRRSQLLSSTTGPCSRASSSRIARTCRGAGRARAALADLEVQRATWAPTPRMSSCDNSEAGTRSKESWRPHSSSAHLSQLQSTRRSSWPRSRCCFRRMSASET